GVLPVTHAGIVDRDAFAAAAAEQSVDRLTILLAGEVPQRDVQRRDGPHFGPGKAAKIHERKQVVPVILDVEGVASDQQGRKYIVNDGAHRAGEVIGFAQANEGVVGGDTNPKVVGQGLSGAGV